MNSEDAKGASDKSNQNQSLSASQLNEAETAATTGNPNENSINEPNLKGDLSSSTKSENGVVLQKAAVEPERLASLGNLSGLSEAKSTHNKSDQLPGSGNMPEPARELNQIPTRMKNLKIPAWKTQ